MCIRDRAGAQAGILNSVAADKAVRDQAQMEAQRVAMAGSALSLNRAVYDALVAISLDGASAATKHYVGRTLLGYQMCIRDRIKTLMHDMPNVDQLPNRPAMPDVMTLDNGRKVKTLKQWNERRTEMMRTCLLYTSRCV